MPINFSLIFSYPWLFARTPLALSYYFLICWLAVAIILIAVGVAIRVTARWRRATPPWLRWWRRVGSLSIGAGIAALVFLFFRYEHVPFFSARFWMVLWALVVGGLIIRLLWKLKRNLPAEVAAHAAAQTRRQYLP